MSSDEVVGREAVRALREAEQARIAKARGEDPEPAPRKAKPTSRAPTSRAPRPEPKGGGKKK